MIIVGIDPGIAIVGWAVLEKEKSKINLIRCGAIETPKTESLEERLKMMYDGLDVVLQKFKPDCAAIEELFFSTNVKTAITVAQARGVLLLSLSQHTIPVISYGPNTVKKIITGDGGADKKMIQDMLPKLLHIDKAPKPDDIADAVAIALTHAYTV
jgi:crossover junction endodeoxyribonuclease RuvC